MSDALNKLSPRKRKYVKARAQGKTKKAAALEAGYSEATAEVAKSHIETPDVRKAFQQLIQSKIPPEKIAQRISEGLDAKETKFFQFQGGVTEEREVVAWTERRFYADLAARYGGYHVDKREVTGPDGSPVPLSVKEIDAAIAELINRAIARAIDSGREA